MSSTKSAAARREPPWDPNRQTIPFPGLFDREPSDDALSLRAAYEKFGLPDQKHNSNGNRAKFRTALSAWEKFWQELVTHGPAENEPPIGQLDTTHLRRFRDWLKQRCSAKTTNVYCGYVRQILRKCGPPDSRNPEGQDILERVPYVRSVPVPLSLPDIVWMQQLGPWYEACRVATWPASSSLPAPLWWRCLLVLCITYGFRTTDVVQLNNSDDAARRKGSKPQGLDWVSVRDSAECPIAAVPYLHELGWIRLRPAKTEKHKPELVLPITAVVRKHLDALPRPRGMDGPRRLILPSPVCCSSFTEQNMRIQLAAGFKLGVDGRGRRQALTPQMLRRSCKSYWTRISPEIARYIGGWSPRTVDERFYLQPLAALLDPDEHGERMLDRFRYPEAFLNGP